MCQVLRHGAVIQILKSTVEIAVDRILYNIDVTPYVERKNERNVSCSISSFKIARDLSSSLAHL